MGGAEVTGPQLQREVAEAGGLPFRQDVPVAFLGRDELAAYLRELFDAEYTVEQARADERLLLAFDLLPAGTDLRALRARVLEDNVAGFYDERPGKRRLYAVSEDRAFTPMNQVILAHELRHALQDQYEDLDSFLGEEVTDFDDRRLAWMSLLEGDATLVMERFVRLRLGALGAASEATGEGAEALGAPGLLDVPGAPPIVRDQLVQPYVVGLAFARALWAHGGPEALREAWGRPPESTEQVLHPAKFLERERPRRVVPAVTPPRGARLVSEGVLGELLLRTLVEGDAGPATEGWGGDGWRLWDVGGKTALAWRSEWDRPADAAEFHAALRARFARRGPGREQARVRGLLRRAGLAVRGASSRRRGGAAVRRRRGAARPPGRGPVGAEVPGGARHVRLPPAARDARVPASGPTSALGLGPGGGMMGTSTPGGAKTNLGLEPNIAGLLCYVPCCIGLVFSVVAAIVEKQSRFVRFHAFQSLLVHAVAIVLGLGLNVAQVALAVVAGCPSSGCCSLSSGWWWESRSSASPSSS